MSTPSRSMRPDPTTGRVVEVLVIGGGSAGLSAAKILARSRRSVVLVDSGTPRNAPADGVHNYLYAEGTPPSELARIGRAETVAYGVQIIDGTACAATVVAQPAPGEARFVVEVSTAGGTTDRIAARRLVLATGLVDLLPDIAGLPERWGRDVLHCPFCHGWEVRDQAIGVVATGPTSLHQTMLFRQLSDDVVYFQHTAPDPTPDQREQLAARGVRHITGEVASIEIVADELSGVRLADGRLLSRRVVAVSTRLEARTDLLADLGLRTSDLELGGHVAGHHLQVAPSGATSTPGVWAAGNVADPMAQVISSAASGAGVGSAIHMDLLTEDIEVAVAAHRDRAGATLS